MWTLFLPFQIIGAMQKLYLHFRPSLTARRLEKFSEHTATSPEVVGAHMLNFRPNFKFSQLIFFRSSWGVR